MRSPRFPSPTQAGTGPENPYPIQFQKALQIVRQEEREFHPSLEDRLQRLREKIAFDEMTQGDVIELFLMFRGRLSDFLILRRSEMAQDVVLAFFPTYRLRQMKVGKEGIWVDLRLATIREHLDLIKELGRTKPSPIQWDIVEMSRSELLEIYTILGEAPSGSPDFPNTIPYPDFDDDNAEFMERNELDFPKPRATDDFVKLIALSKQLESIIGETEAQFVFPELHVPQSREHVVAISKLLFDGIQATEKEARRSALAVMQMRMRKEDYAAAMAKSQQSISNPRGTIEVVANLKRAMDGQADFQDALVLLEEQMHDRTITEIRARQLRFIEYLYKERQHTLREKAIRTYLRSVAKEMEKIPDPF